MADEGPFFNDDFRVAGDTRLIRARPGYRPIVRIERSSSEAVRKQPAVFVLDRQNLILDGIDLVVDVRDVSPEQTALFSCAGSTSDPEELLDHDPQSSATRRSRSSGSNRLGRVPTRIRLERTLVRGGFAAGVDLAGGSTELALNKSVIVGGPGPLVRVDRRSVRARKRDSSSSTASSPGRGPIIELSRNEHAGPDQAAVDPGVRIGLRPASRGGSRQRDLLVELDAREPRNRSTGEETTTCSRAGRASSPAAATPSSPCPAWPRSVPRGTGQTRKARRFSRRGLIRLDLAAVTPEELEPFVPNREKILWQVAQPRQGLFQKAVGEYPSPADPSARGLGIRALGSVPETPARRHCDRSVARRELNEPGRCVGKPRSRAIAATGVRPIWS